MIYNYDEVFEDIPDDPDNVLLKLPPELCEELGWHPGKTLTIKVEDDKLIIFETRETNVDQHL